MRLGCRWLPRLGGERGIANETNFLVVVQIRQGARYAEGQVWLSALPPLRDTNVCG